MDEFIKNFAFDIDGNSSLRVKEIILKELNLNSK